MSDDELSEEPEYELVMPFVVCASQGGPFDDDAFVAGFRCGAVDRMLADDPTLLCDSVMARAPELPQLDLIAMRHGFAITHEPADEEWFNVTFTRATSP